MKWIPVVAVPTVVGIVLSEAEPWVLMWGLAISVYAGLKWLSLIDSGMLHRSSLARSLGYLFFWPGMDAKSFASTDQSPLRPLLREWGFAISKLVLGIALVILASRWVANQPLISGWAGMIGVVFSLHFGLFHIVSLLWRRVGVIAPPIMQAPILSSSLSEFWGKRWNLAFRDLAHIFVFRPAIGRLGAAGATMAVFLVSGLVHDAVISIPARGGWGLPTVYFLLQGFGILVERSRLGRQFTRHSQLRGRLFAILVILGPLGLLFHRPFVERVVAPMLEALTKIGG